MAARGTGAGPVHQLKVTIKHIRPPVWRRLQVPGDISLADLHEVLQAAFGWTDSHLHQFVVAGARYGVPHPDYDDWGPPMHDERRVRLGDVVAQGKKSFVYEYDFGDGWEHAIVVEKSGEAEPGADYPRCLAGRRAGPPEDCGGPWGYMELLETVANPDDPEHEAMREWLGETFDPEAFELDELNALLRPRRLRADRQRRG